MLSLSPFSFFRNLTFTRAAGLGLALFPVLAVHAEDAPVDLPPEVVTSPANGAALEVVLDAQAPAQPLPAQDGADFLKHVPGFSVIRKGGTDGDPVFRGLAGSRLVIQLDGMCVLGGCGNRMDPPTAYVFPAAYDRVRVLKGPQSVRYGAGNAAGVVLFETDAGQLPEDTLEGQASVTVGSFGRLDLAGDLTAGTSEGFGRIALTRTEGDDYESGADEEVHARHLRWSAQAMAGWTPDADTLVKFTAIQSDGEAAYADRSMDGSAFDREIYSFKARRENLSPLVQAVQLEAGYTYVDHVMDNYSLRTFVPSMMMPNPSVSNPDRRTLGARAVAELTPADGWEVVAGLDYQGNRHRVRSTMNEKMMPYEDKAFAKDAEFAQFGGFSEATWHLSAADRVVFGGRVDHWEAEDHRQMVQVSMMSSVANPTAGAKRSTNLPSGFVRYEHGAPDDATTYYVGLGHTARFLDYWELIKNESLTSVSAFYLDPERTTQLDIGATQSLGDVQLSISAFTSQIDDFALVQSGVSKPAGMMGTRSAVVTRNIQARTLGAEMAANWQPLPYWQVDASLAYVRGENVTDDRPLAQIPPLEGRLGLRYTRDAWAVGALVRAVAEQDRVAVNQGNIVGQDVGPSDGFATLALNAAWSFASFARLTAGVDNVFDEDYAEHISRAGSAMAGYVQTTRVPEPGRTFWMRLDVSY